MTEEDTFRRLKRIPLEEMHNIYMSDKIALLCRPGVAKYNKKLFNKYGWTVEEYTKEIDRRLR